MKISIIIPIYNAASFLDECLKSVLYQTYADWEAILVNDGSTDGSASICDDYAKKDCRFRVIHKENTGVSDSKNKALDMATGEYIIFLDADDYWIAENCLETLLTTAIEHNADIVRGDYKTIKEDNSDIPSNPNDKNRIASANKILNSTQFFIKILQGEFFLVLSLFKRSCIEHLRFNRERVFLEDKELYARIMVQELKCIYIPLYFYAYRKHHSSASAALTWPRLRDAFTLCYTYIDLLNEIKDNELLQSYTKRATITLYEALKTLTYEPFYSNRRSICKKLKINELRKKILSLNSQYKTPIISSILFFPPTTGTFIQRYWMRIRKLPYICYRKLLLIHSQK